MTNEQEKKEEGSGTSAAAADDAKDAAVHPGSSSGLFTVEFTKLDPLPDDKYGRPCSRSSHGVSVVSHKQMIVVMGGEHIARTPLDPDQFVWIAEKKEVEDEWKWRNVRPPPPKNEDNSDSKPSWPPMRVAHAQACIENDIYIFGGRAGIDMSECAMNDLWKFHIPSETWTLIKPASEVVPEARSFHRMVVHNGHKLFVFGGCGSKGRLNDLVEFDISTSKWINHGSSKILAGRGGPNVLPFRGGYYENENFEPYIAIVAGFKGEESNDGHICRRSNKEDGGDDDVLLHDWIWDTEGMTKEDQLINLRPRSVCISGTFPKCNLGIIFGGEVNPSDRGHEGAGGFANDIILLDGNQNGKIIEQISAPTTMSSDKPTWPEARGWSSGDTMEDTSSKKQLYFFGGLTGDDTNPKRLDDLWLCEIQETK